MPRGARRFVPMLIVAALAAGAALALLPRRYECREQLSGVAVFWHEGEAFVFVERYAIARSTNAVVERLPQSGAWAAAAPLWSEWRALLPDTTAYHLTGDGIERYELPNGLIHPAWDLEDGRLVARTRLVAGTGQGYRWTGRGFARLAPAQVGAPPTAARSLRSDDEEPDESDGRGPGFLTADARDRLVRAGWHFKHLTGYEGIEGPATLSLGSRSGAITLRSERRSDPMQSFATTVELTADQLSPRSRVLFADAGWTGISRVELEARTPPGRPASSLPTFLLVVLLLALGLLALKTGGALKLVLPFFGLKKRLLRSVGTTTSFPPALPEQFSQLDRARLDLFSRDLEGLGFEKLLDTAPVGDTPTHTPSFCRIYAHRRHACFAVLMQSFPVIGGPIDLRCMINGHLDDGWSLGVSNGKPLAASAFVRRPRAIGVLRPGAGVDELLARFLPFRDQMCTDLGVRPLGDTSLATYIRLTIQSLAEIRAAMRKRSLAAGVGRYYSRKLGIASEKSQLVRLGDYPKLADERRAAGLGPGFSGTAALE